MLLFSGTANNPLAAKIAAILQTSLGAARISRFSDGEIQIEILEQVKNQDIFIIQPTSPPVHEHLIELCLLAGALQHAGAKTITAVIPYFGYAREGWHANIIAKMLTAVNVSTVITVDFHNEKILNCFEIPIINLHAASLFLQDPALQQLQQPVVVAPDFGAIARAAEFAANIKKSEVVIIEKCRLNTTTKVVNIYGNVANRDCVIIDDIIDSGSTILNAATALHAQGAHRIFAYCTHGVFSDTKHLLSQKNICEHIVCTDSIAANSTKIPQISVAPLLAAAIQNMQIHTISKHNLQAA